MSRCVARIARTAVRVAVSTEEAMGLTMRSRRTARHRAPTDLSSRRKTRRLRAMDIVVCVKQIPDPAAPGALDPTTNALKRDGKLILDESDSYGVEMGLQLATAAG